MWPQYSNTHFNCYCIQLNQKYNPDRIVKEIHQGPFTIHFSSFLAAVNNFFLFISSITQRDIFTGWISTRCSHTSVASTNTNG